MRPRDALGRIVEAGSPLEVPAVPQEALPPHEALGLARSLLAEGRAFAAHEVFEASWKAAPPHERDLWQGLAQVCVGITHYQRGNTIGAVTLLRRGASHLREYDGAASPAPAPPAAVAPTAVADRAEALAASLGRGAALPEVLLIV